MEVKKIINLYKHIDKEIEKLHQLSNNDFTSLNTIFKDNYEKSKLIFDHLRDLNKELQKFAPLSLSSNQVIDREFNQLKSILQKRFLNIENGIEKSQNLIDSLLVPIKNYKQNILTINFIISQVYILKNYITAPENRAPKEIKNLFAELNQLFIDFHEKIESIKKLIDEGLENVLKFKSDFNTQVDSYAGTSGRVVKLIQEKQILIDDYSFKLNYEEFIQEQSNEIIVSLQYHDIIRQKMDHVQETYKDFLLGYLKNDFGKNEKTKDKSILPYLANLADLQSAQLTHVNKKYQDAIKTINKSIIKISNLVDYNMEQMNELLATGSMDFPSRIIQDLKQFAPNKIELDKGITYSEDINNKLSKHMNECLIMFKKIKLKNIALINLIKEIIFKESNQSILNENLYLQLINISNDTTRLSKEINLNLQKNDKLLSNLAGTRINVTQNLNMFADNYNDYIKLYNDIVEIIGLKKHEVNKIFKEIINDKDNSSSSLLYYNYFENAIQKIIEELTLITEEAVSNGVSISPEQFKNEFEDIKQLYTMKSELLIHNNLSNLNTNQILTDIEEEDDNVEFF